MLDVRLRQGAVGRSIFVAQNYLRGGEFFNPCYVRPGYALAPAVTNSYRTPYTPPILCAGSRKAEAAIVAGGDCLLGLARIHSRRDSCRTQVAR